jgi:hypothetical protein
MGEQHANGWRSVQSSANTVASIRFLSYVATGAVSSI